MSGPAPTTVLSVRGDAVRTVAPDAARLTVELTAVAPTAARARADAGAELGRLTAALGTLGGATATPDTGRAPLTWAAGSLRTAPEHADDGRGSWGPTGRQLATVGVEVTVRDLALLAAVEPALTGSDALSVNHVEWIVDEDNPQWPAVRADAIRAALRRGGDYAAALGGQVLGVDQVADAGLLDGSGPRGESGFAMQSAARTAGGDGGWSLDPPPQRMRAVIDARLRCSAAAVPPPD